MDSRQSQILTTTVDHFINTAEPVGSKTVSSNSSLSVSTATIRHELNHLEKSGYLKQLHTSSGRIPTDKGYRQYVNQLIENGACLTKNKQSYVKLGQNVSSSLSDIREMMISVIDYTTIIITPSLFLDSIKAFHLILVDLNKILMVLLSTSGITEEIVINTHSKIKQEDLNELSQLLTSQFKGKPLSLTNNLPIENMLKITPKYANLLPSIKTEIKKLSDFHKKNHSILTGGVSKMLKLPEFKNIELTQNVLSCLENNEKLLKIFNEFINNESPVVIGTENDTEELNDCSVVFSSIKENNETVGAIGVLGPTRMAYSNVLPLLDNLTQSINRYINNSTLEEVV